MNYISSYLLMSGANLYPVVVFKVIIDKYPEDSLTEMAIISEKINTYVINNVLLSPYARNINSEFQAILSNGEFLISHILKIRELLYPRVLQFGIGIGSVTTPINNVGAVLIEGRAERLARKLLKSSPKYGHYLKIGGFSSKIDALIEPIAELIWSKTDKWNMNRLKIVNNLLAAEQIGMEISKRAIYKNIKEGNLKSWVTLIRQFELNVSNFLSTYNEKC